MKLFLLFFAFCFSMRGLAQPDSIVCGQLPFAHPDVQAVYESDLYDFFVRNLPAGLKKKGVHLAAFRILVDCNGNVTDVKVTQGNLSEAHREHYVRLIYGMTWKPATHASARVSSFVFVTVEVKNGSLSYWISA